MRLRELRLISRYRRKLSAMCANAVNRLHDAGIRLGGVVSDINGVSARAMVSEPVYFGVLFIMSNAIGLITPSVGAVLNFVAGIGKMRIDDVTLGVLLFMAGPFMAMPFMAVQFAVLFLMVFFPWLVTGPAWFSA